MHIKKTWAFLNSIEYEYTYLGNYGAKGEKRAERVKPTPEQVKKQNMINKVNRVRRLIKANFGPGDYWITLKYAKGTRKTVNEVRKDMKRFIEKMRKKYKKQGCSLKYIFRVEIGKRGGIHIHIILNRIDGKPGTDVLVERCWCGGHPNFQMLYEEGGYDQLASYLVKGMQGEEENEEVAPVQQDAYLIGYHTSRNLVRPVPDVRKYKRSLKKLIEEGPVPTEGFYIDRDTLKAGKNRFTGKSYLRYTEVRIKPLRRGDTS